MMFNNSIFLLKFLISKIEALLERFFFFLILQNISEFEKNEIIKNFRLKKKINKSQPEINKNLSLTLIFTSKDSLLHSKNYRICFLIALQ